MSAWVWLRADVLLAVHDEQLAERGGASSFRDAGLFESALARPQQLAHCEHPDVADLAAACGWGLARSHPFIDGNKRTAFVAAELFLACNGCELLVDDADAVLTMLAVAAGTMEETAFAAWLRKHQVLR
jgi:death-on-curing protein